MSPFSDLAKEAISWEIELTTRCNSRCVGCSRYIDYFDPNPHFNPRVDLELQLLKKALEGTAKVDFILFCGVYGDPFFHPQIIPILDYIRDTFGSVKISVHTNGAYGTKTFWKDVAAYFKTPGSHVKFSVDGIGNSHEIFRRGTDWEVLVANAREFIAAGGNAIWKMIEFDHNAKDIEAARELSQKWGFKKFELRSNNFPGLDEIIRGGPDSRSSVRDANVGNLSTEELTHWNTSQVRAKKFEVIRCKSLERKSLYLDAHGSIWPCCWVGGLPYRPEPFLRQWMEKNVTGSFEPSFNSLRKKTLGEILNHEWLGHSLPASWKSSTAHESQHSLIATCAKTCGECTNQKAQV